MRAALLVCVLLLSLSATAGAQPRDVSQGLPPHDLNAQLTSLREAVISLPLAMALGALLAFRPRRLGTPPRTPAVVQTQIILAIVGALVMLVVGQSLARAFGIVGAASLIRYRAKVEDPKDAGVMLTALGIGLASGVGLYMLAGFGALFVLGVLWVVESFEPNATKLFTLKVTAKEPEKLKEPIERLLRQSRAEFDLRTASADEVCYEVQLPINRRTETVSKRILSLAGGGEVGVEWSERKAK
jgi:hypothetical protein